MNYKKMSLSIVLGLAICQGAFATSTPKEIKDFDINSIEYIEEEEVIDLGFNTADYLPESFDPNSFYFDINSVDYINDTIIEEEDFSKHLPVGFDAYAYATDVQSINYIDAKDEIVLDFNTKIYLPKNFNAFAVK
ncbi:hypothetical protein [uncultured Maribacter sp.]|uniref:hypothetical protein n=1 Tax=uncultured Maribacter sp. TaxID=431308 RepID=UPI002623A4B8|nr:hypothetical protein [uncultured Maribacter sp.]